MQKAIRRKGTSAGDLQDKPATVETSNVSTSIFDSSTTIGQRLDPLEGLVPWTYHVFQILFQSVQFSHTVMSGSETPWAATRLASLSITNTWSLLKLMSITSAMPSNHLILCRPLLLSPSIFPSIRVFSSNQLFTSGGQSIGVSASASVLPMNTRTDLL